MLRSGLFCIVTSVGIGASVFAAYAMWWQWPKTTLTFSMLDIGQGDALYIRTPNGIDVLIDGGPDDGVGRTLGSHMALFDRSLDIVVATHSDLDHIGGLIGILNRYSVGTFITANSTSSEPVRLALDEMLRANYGTHRVVGSGDRIELDPVAGIYLDVLSPDRATTTEDSNDRSLVMRLVYASTSIMLTGDAGEDVEEKIVSRYGHALASTVLKVGHHGSNTSTSESFLGFVAPTFALISAGKDNSFGHPRQEVLDRLTAIGAEIYQTKNEGSVTLASDGISFWRIK